MANLTITNNANALGVYEGAGMELANTQAAVVVLVEDITMTMVAAKTRWADKLANEYTVTITVADGGAPLELDEDSVITFTTDEFDSAVVVDTDSVQVSGNTPAAIAMSGGKLTMNLTEDIVDGTPTVITFDVYKAGTEPTP